MGRRVKLFWIFILIVSDTTFATSGADKSACAKLLAQRIGLVTPDKSSYAQINYPLVEESVKRDILQKILAAFGSKGNLSKSNFFTQFTVNHDGTLRTIIDPTFKKDSGRELAAVWEKDKQVKNDFQRIYNNARALAEDIRHSLPETEIQLAEVVFTLQVNKVSENWHLDWYDQEYLIATQTFIAKRLGSDGSLVDENFAGTEYLLFGDSPEVMEAILHTWPKQIEFKVNTDPPIGLVGKGFFYASETGLLSVHSGTSRVHRALQIPKDVIGYSLVSPPHRGSYKDLVIRASLAIRFKPAEAQ
jgi:hypothetical protein